MMVLAILGIVIFSSMDCDPKGSIGANVDLVFYVILEIVNFPGCLGLLASCILFVAIRSCIYSYFEFFRRAGL